MQGASLPSAFALSPAVALRGQALRQASGSLSAGPTMVPLLDLQTTSSQAVPTGTVPNMLATAATTQHPSPASQLPPARQPSTSLPSSVDRLVALLVNDPRFAQAVQAANTSHAAVAAIEVMKAHITVFTNALPRQPPPPGVSTYPTALPSVPTMVPQAVVAATLPLVSAASSVLESASPTKRALDAEAPSRSQVRRDSGTRRGDLGRELKPGEMVKITHGNKRTADHIVGQYAKVVSVETNGWVNCQLVSTTEVVRLQQRYLATATPLPPATATPHPPATATPLPPATATPHPPATATPHPPAAVPTLGAPIIPSPAAPVPVPPPPPSGITAVVPLPPPAPTPSMAPPSGPMPAVTPVLPPGMMPTSQTAVPVPVDAVAGGTVTSAVPVVCGAPPPVAVPRTSGEAMDVCGLTVALLPGRGVTKAREVVRTLRKELLFLEEEIPWNAVKESKWRSGRNAWRRAVRNAETVTDLATKLGDLHDNLKTDKTQGLFQTDGTWHRCLNECIQGKTQYQAFQSVWEEWRTAVQDWLYTRAQNLPPPADPVSQANASRAAAALDIAALFGTDYVEQVPLESILNHHRESFDVLKSMVERERAHVAAKIEALNSEGSGEAGTTAIDTQLASSLLSILHDNTAMKGVTGLTHYKAFQSDVDTDMEDGSDATDLNDSDMD